MRWSGAPRTVVTASVAAMLACVWPAPINRVAAQTPSAPSLAAPLANTGAHPGPAFLMDLRNGFDWKSQYLSDYAIKQSWNGSAFDPENVRFGNEGAKLLIQKRRSQGLDYASAELQRKGFYGYGRYEAVMRAAAGSGLVSSFFTHTSPQFGDPHDEIDFEFLGRNTHQVHLAYFTNGISKGSVYAPTGFDTSLAFHLYAFEWAPDSIRWFVDGKQLYEVHGPDAHVPRASGRVIVNLWTGGPDGIVWLGEPEFKNNTSATYRCVSHVPLGETAPQCSDTFRPPAD